MQRYAEQEYGSGGLYQEYIRARDLKYATFRRRIPVIRQFAPGLRLLDVGCSCGYFIDVALQSGFDAHGVEFSERAIAAASDAARPRIVQGDVNVLDIQRSARYDVVAAFDIIEHTLDPVQFLSSLYRALNDRGLVVITTPDTDHILRQLMGRRWPMLQPFQHMVLFSRKSLPLALEKAGFHMIEITAAQKVLTLDYLMQQVRVYLPTLTRAYQQAGRILPTRVRTWPLAYNIGEIVVLARRTE